MQIPMLTFEDALLQAQQLLISSQFQRAIYLTRHLLQIQPLNPVPFYILGLALTQQKQFTAAREPLQYALKLAPERAELWLALGKTFDGEQKFNDAHTNYLRACEYAPTNVLMLYALARNHEAMQQTEPALALYRKMATLAPENTDVREGLWRCLRNLKLRDELCLPENAKQATTSILRIIRAKTLIEQGKSEQLAEAERLLKTTLASEPKHPDALAALSLLYRMRGEFAHCLPVATSLIEVQPDRVEGYLGCIESYIAAGHDEAAWQVGQLAAKKSNSYAMLLHAATFIAHIPHSVAHIQAQRQRVKTAVQKIIAAGAKANDPLREAPQTYFYFAYHGCNNREMLSFLADGLRKLAPSLSYKAAHISKQRRSGPLRIAFISTFMRDHPVGRCFQPLLLAMIKQGDVSIQVYARLKAADPLQQQLREHGIDVHELPTELTAARQAIAATEPDVLLYGDIGMDNLTYQLAFSRLAKLQCLLPGHPETSGVDTLDYVISQVDLEGPQPQARYRETPVLLRSFTMAYPSAKPQLDKRSRSELQLPAERFYLVPAKLQKIHPDFDRLLAGILRQDQDAVVLFFDDLVATGWSHSLRTRLYQQYPDITSRIRFRPWAEKGDFQAILSLADVVLDPTHFGLGTTAIYAFVQGVPIVTRPYDNLASRSVYALLTRLGVTDTIARTDAEFVEVACNLAKDPERRRQIGARINARFSKLFDEGDAATELLGFLRDKLNRMNHKANGQTNRARSGRST